MKLPNRPWSLKLAFTFAILGLAVGIGITILNKEAYGDGWVLFIPARIFMAIVWLSLFVLALNGRNWVRYVFGGVVLLSLAWAGYWYPDHLVKEGLWVWYLPSILALVFFFAPPSSEWYRSVKQLVAQQNAQADAG